MEKYIIIIEEELFKTPVNICSYFGSFKHTRCRFSNQTGNRPSAKVYDKDKQYRYWFRRFDNPRLESIGLTGISEKIEGGTAQFTLGLKKQLSGVKGDVEQMRFWINNRRISRLCYLISYPHDTEEL